MSIVVASQFALKRARRQLENAFKQGNWQAVRESDIELGRLLNKAFDEKSLDTRALVSELEIILTLYADMVATLPEQHDAAFISPKK